MCVRVRERERDRKSEREREPNLLTKAVFVVVVFNQTYNNAVIAFSFFSWRLRLF